MTYSLYVGVKIALLIYDVIIVLSGMMSGHEYRPILMSCKDSVRERRKRNPKSYSFFSSFDSEDRSVPISDYFSNVPYKQKSTSLGNQDVIVTSSPSVAEPSIVLIITTSVSSTKLSETHDVSSDFSPEVFELNRTCRREEDSSSVTSHRELTVDFEPSHSPSQNHLEFPTRRPPSHLTITTSHAHKSGSQRSSASLARSLGAITTVPIVHLLLQLSLLKAIFRTLLGTMSWMDWWM